MPDKPSIGGWLGAAAEVIAIVIIWAGLYFGMLVIASLVGAL